MKKKFDVCFSFAGEQRDYVEETYNICKKMGLKVFYDKSVEVELWGKNLIEVFFDIYKNKADYCIMFISEQYAKKCWTVFERRTALEKALISEKEYILPVRFDDTAIPGLHDSISYLDARVLSPAELAHFIIQKSNPDLLNNTKSLHEEIKEFLNGIFHHYQNKFVLKEIKKDFYIYKKERLSANLYSAKISFDGSDIKILNIDFFDFNETNMTLKVDNFEEMISLCLEKNCETI